MSLSYALGDDADLRRRLMIKIGAPLAVREPLAVTAVSAAAVGKNHTVETPDRDTLERLISEIYQVAQDIKR